MKRIHILFSSTLTTEYVILLVSALFALLATIYSLSYDLVLAYGDIESHLNIAKRVTHSLTPGLAQLGGIWLPLPHLLMIPFTYFDIFWRTGLAGSIVSGTFFVIACVYLYKLVKLLTKSVFAGIIAFLVFSLNPNILYMQSTAMTEIPLIALFIGSTYYFVYYLRTHRMQYLILSAVFGLGATLTRYDGWFLVMSQVALLVYHFGMQWISTNRKESLRTVYSKIEGIVLTFATLAFAGIVLWLIWDYLILGDPLYFSNSPFSAKSQQQGWLSRGMLPTYQNFPLSVIYYVFTSGVNIGYFITAASLVGFVLYWLDETKKHKLAVSSLLLNPVFFYVITLYIGQSIIYIPELTPDWYEWQLFNVRYGILMVPFAAVFTGFGLYKIHTILMSLIDKIGWKNAHVGNIRIHSVVTNTIRLSAILLISIQSVRFILGTEPVITLKDGVEGLSSADITDAQYWLKENYDGGYILIDDYARTLSVIRSGLPMENTIYVGTKPYWEESLENPQKYAEWVILQKDDTVWKHLYEPPEKQAELYKYYVKAYTSPQILIFKRQGFVKEQLTQEIEGLPKPEPEKRTLLTELAPEYLKSFYR